MPCCAPWYGAGCLPWLRLVARREQSSWCCTGTWWCVHVALGRDKQPATRWVLETRGCTAGLAAQCVIPSELGRGCPLAGNLWS